MGKQVTDITRTWMRPNPIMGEKVESFMKKRKPVKNLGEGKVVVGMPWDKPEFHSSKGQPVKHGEKSS